jgi:hypothetical protein
MYEIASRKLPYTEEYWDRFQRNGHFQAKDCQNAIVKDQCRPTPPPDCPPEFAKLMQVRIPGAKGNLTMPEPSDCEI